MQLLVGLGNPGDKYRNNRHNIGFMAVDAIAERHRFPSFRKKFKGFVAEGEITGERVLLLKPDTFMNDSGDSVVQAQKFFKLEPGQITVFYDELDLTPGKVRVKVGGGNGGHNGLRSIDPQVGTGYRRVRLGIGHPGKEFVTPHVLGDFSNAERAWLEALLDAVAEHAGLLVRGDDNGFMNKLALLGVGKEAETNSPAPAARAQSHIRAARQAAPSAKLPETGPMAAMLRKIFKPQ